MDTMAQRIETLRTGRNLSRPALSAALGLPRTAVEKFETGRATPTQAQQEQLAAYFGVSVFYLRGESTDPTTMDDWMDGAFQDPPAPAPAPPPSGGRRPPPAERAACSTRSSPASGFRRPSGPPCWTPSARRRAWPCWTTPSAGPERESDPAGPIGREARVTGRKGRAERNPGAADQRRLRRFPQLFPRAGTSLTRGMRPAPRLSAKGRTIRRSLREKCFHPRTRRGRKQILLFSRLRARTLRGFFGSLSENRRERLSFAAVLSVCAGSAEPVRGRSAYTSPAAADRRRGPSGDEVIPVKPLRPSRKSRSGAGKAARQGVIGG